MAKIVTVYFSMTGQTWADGGIVDLDKGFTNIAAEYIQEKIGGDIFRIQQKRRYSADHYTMIDEAKAELQNDERPNLVSFMEDFDDYDTVFLGFPNWWGTIPMPVVTFLEHYDWNGKKIIPFVTSGGSGFGRALNDIRKYAKNAMVDTDGLEILGTRVEKSRNKIQKWAESRI